MAGEMKSVLESLQAGAAWLEKKGVPEARRNMEYLLAHALGCKRLDLYLQFDRPLGEAELAPMRVLLRRRGAREPLQHLLGTEPFCGHEFLADPRALIPRPETGELVAKLVAAGPPAHPRVLDLGCGGGAIGLSLAAAWAGSGCEFVLADLSPAALAQAGENRARLGLDAAPVELVESDLFLRVRGPFGLVAANLPYLDAADMAALQPELRFDPALALDGGPDGLALLRRFCAEVAPLLAPGGTVALESGAGQPATVAAWLAEAGFEEPRVEPDFNGIDRFVFAAKPA
jgi:release factor glutamine methyltransferase